jgi:uncharacterized protein YgiB involved in biofilm formation
MFKRSQRVTPAIIGSVMSLTLLTACGEKQEDASVFENIEQCVQDGQYNQVQCQELYAKAQAEHKDVAPKFENKADCEAEFGVGRCENEAGNNGSAEVASGDIGGDTGGHTTVVHHHSSFMPMMAGIMIGRAISQPMYRPYHGGTYGAFMTNRGMPVSSTVGRQKIARSIVTSRPTRSTTTLKRGGFGAMSRSSISS